MSNSLCVAFVTFWDSTSRTSNFVLLLPCADLSHCSARVLPIGFRRVSPCRITTFVEQAESRADELSKTQISFKRALVRDIRDFCKDVTKFRTDFVRDGPMVQVGGEGLSLSVFRDLGSC